jgi:mono/diheme cytochrome c family protein
MNRVRQRMIWPVITALAALAAAGSIAQAQSLLERGEYLVNAVMGCDGCHTPRPKGEFNYQRKFSGGSQIWDTTAYTVRGSNITPDRETGIGAWSADDLKRAITQGVRPNGIPLAPQMPNVFYKILTPGDLDAVAAYIRSVQPLSNQVPAPVYKAASEHHDIPGADKPFSDAMLADPVKRGFYLATIAHCMECHARTPDGKQDYVNWWGRGGAIFGNPGSQAKAANITSHKTAGVGAWTDAEIKRTLTHGVGRDGRLLVQQMQRQVYFAKMTDQDLDAIVAWVRTIPPLE